MFIYSSLIFPYIPPSAPLETTAAQDNSPPQPQEEITQFFEDDGQLDLSSYYSDLSILEESHSNDDSMTNGIPPARTMALNDHMPYIQQELEEIASKVNLPIGAVAASSSVAPCPIVERRFTPPRSLTKFPPDKVTSLLREDTPSYKNFKKAYEQIEQLECAWSPPEYLQILSLLCDMEASNSERDNKSMPEAFDFSIRLADKGSQKLTVLRMLNSEGRIQDLKIISSEIVESKQLGQDDIAGLSTKESTLITEEDSTQLRELLKQQQIKPTRKRRKRSTSAKSEQPRSKERVLQGKQLQNGIPGTGILLIGSVNKNSIIPTRYFPWDS